MNYPERKKTGIKVLQGVEPQGFSDPFLDYMSKDVELDEITKDLVTQHCRPISFPKGHRLQQTGMDCRNVYFIVKGECISYFTDFKGKTTTWFFHFNRPEASVKNIFAVDYKSFLSRQPATLSIETLSEVTAIRFSREEVNFLIDNCRIFERWMRKINEKAFIMTYDRITTLLTMSATERYKKFLKDEAYLLNMFSNHYIATYLDVTPQSLSRIRKNIT